MPANPRSGWSSKPRRTNCGSVLRPALDLARVADGTVDGYVEFGLGHEDYAAGVALVAAAGGVVVVVVVEIVDISPWRGPLVIAAGTQTLVDQMREVIRSIGVPNV